MGGLVPQVPFRESDLISRPNPSTLPGAPELDVMGLSDVDLKPTTQKILHTSGQGHFEGISHTKPSFGVISAEVVINCSDTSLLKFVWMRFVFEDFGHQGKSFFV